MGTAGIAGGIDAGSDPRGDGGPGGPVALPHSIAWLLFVAALAGGGTIGALRGHRAGRRTGSDGALGLVGLIVATMVASMVITFFAHDL
ncbi:MAG TPA: hypothetical protein VFT84_07990 [Gemmatimonadales bacterium]|nr:hypothetical protein [Gemmatimonadales bacterium]